MMVAELETIRTKAVNVLKCFDEVVAVGLAGSQALGVADEFSDLDLQAFAARVPPLDRRRALYAQHGVETGPLDHPVAEGFENPPCSSHFVVDWLTINGMKVDFLWLPCAEVDDLLSKLPEQAEQREALAVLAETVQPVSDPHDYLARMKQNCPPYPMARASQKACGKLHYAHFFLCGWAVLSKCLFRKDVIAYQMAESEMIRVLIDSLFAVNRKWQVDGRRLRFHAKDFHILPEAFVDRLESIVCRKGQHAELNACHAELLSLFRDLTVAANQAHGWQLPIDWQIKEK